MDQSRFIREFNSLHPNRTGDNREWRKTGSGYNHRRFIEEKTHRRETQKRIVWGVVVIVALFLVISVLLVYLHYDPVDEHIVCVPGFSGDRCERTNFIGTFVWSKNEYYTLSDGLQHRNGIAFRVYAPYAKSVSVLVKPVMGLEAKYKMIQQINGYWFVNVGSVGVHSEFVYVIESLNGSTNYRLLQGGKEAIITPRGWRNREPDDSMIHTTTFSSNSKAISKVGSDIMYTLHIPSFSSDDSYGYGTFSSTISFLPYLKNLGVTIIRIMDLSPQSCDGTIHVSCWYHSHVVYPDVTHPDLGSQRQLLNLINAIHSLDMNVIVDIDWTGFDSFSNYYDYDGSGKPTDFGSLFQNTTEYDYLGRRSRSVNLNVDHPGALLLSEILSRYKYTYQFDGVYWRGLLCMRLDDENCQLGIGRDNRVNSAFLRNIKTELNGDFLWFGEDDDNIHFVSNNSSTIVNIVNTYSNQGLEFNGKRDLSVCMSIRHMYFHGETVNLSNVISYVNQWKAFDTKSVISLESFDTLHTKRLIEEVRNTTGYPSSMLYPMIMQMYFLLYAHPGIIGIYQGSEYLETTSMSDYPTPLDIPNKVGIFDNGDWLKKGDFFWFYDYTKRCLTLRQSLSLFTHHDLNLIYKDESISLLVFGWTDDSRSYLLLLHPNPKPMIEEISIPLPAPFGKGTIWENEFNTDSPDYYYENELIDEPISLYKCMKNEKLKWCGSVRMGSFSTRVLFATAKSL